MRVYIVEHEGDPRQVYCPTRQQALDMLSLCIRKQENRKIEDRHSVTIRLGSIPAEQFDEMEDIPDGQC